MKIISQHVGNDPTYLGGLQVATIKAQFGQQLSVTVLSWVGGNPDRVRTRWGAILKRGISGLYEPE